MKIIHLSCRALVLVFLFAPFLQADIILTIRENGPHIDITTEGSVDLNGLTTGSTFGITSSQFRAQSNLIYYTGTSTQGLEYTGGTLSYTPPLPTSIQSTSISGTGMMVGFQSSDRLFLDPGYISNSPNNGLMQLLNTSFNDLGLQTGITSTYSWSAISGPQQVVIQTLTAIPESSTVVLAMVLIGTSCLLGRRKL